MLASHHRFRCFCASVIASHAFYSVPLCSLDSSCLQYLIEIITWAYARKIQYWCQYQNIYCIDESWIYLVFIWCNNKIPQSLILEVNLIHQGWLIMSSPTNKNLRNSGGGTNGNLNEKGPRGIDRETKCPLLLRVFCATSRHNSISDYNKGQWKVNISM